MITQLTQIVESARSRGRRRLAVACANDAHTLRAVEHARREGLVEATLFGDRAGITATCQAEGIDPGNYAIVDEANDMACVNQAVALVAGNGADVLMKGLVSTDKYMRGILNKEAGLFPPKGTLSHVSVVELPGRGKLLSVADVAVIPLPDLKQKTILIGYLANIARSKRAYSPRWATEASWAR